MELNSKKGKIDFQDVEGLTRLFGNRRTIRKRFRLPISERDCSNGIYAAMKAEVMKRGGSLIFDDATRQHIAKAAKWLIGEDDKPAIMLRGTVGNGKTTLMRAIISLVSLYTESEKGYSDRVIIPEWSARKIAMLCGDESGRKEYRRLLETPYLAIDEFGEEPSEIISYGMVYEPMKDILLERYNKQLFTLITTNLPREEIEKRYSGRIADRFTEMLAIINFTNPSYRKITNQ